MLHEQVVDCFAQEHRLRDAALGRELVEARSLLRLEVQGLRVQLARRHAPTVHDMSRPVN